LKKILPRGKTNWGSSPRQKFGGLAKDAMGGVANGGTTHVRRRGTNPEEKKKMFQPMELKSAEGWSGRLSRKKLKIFLDRIETSPTRGPTLFPGKGGGSKKSGYLAFHSSQAFRRDRI